MGYLRSSRTGDSVYIQYMDFLPFLRVVGLSQSVLDDAARSGCEARPLDTIDEKDNSRWQHGL